MKLVVVGTEVEDHNLNTKTSCNALSPHTAATFRSTELANQNVVHSARVSSHVWGELEHCVTKIDMPMRKTN